MKLQKTIRSLISAALLYTSSCCAPALIIDQPGFYTLGEGINYTAGIGDSIISIQTNDVVLDLGGNTISQVGINSADGITIASGVDRITIQNGTISNVVNRGIFVDTTISCDQIAIKNITFDNCQTRGISVEGLSGLTNSSISHCEFTDCRGPSAISFLADISSCTVSDIHITFRAGSTLLANFSGIASSGNITSSKLLNIHISNGSAGGFNVIGLNLTALTGSAIDTVTIQNFTGASAFSGISASAITASNITNVLCQKVPTCTSFVGIASTTISQLVANGIGLEGITATGSITGISATSINDSALFDFSMSGISAGTSCTGCTSTGIAAGVYIHQATLQSITSQTYVGFNFPGAINRSILAYCNSINITTTSTASHISLASSSTIDLFIGCLAQGITAGGTLNAFNVPSGTASRLVFIDCIAEGCATTSTACAGFSLVGCTNCFFYRCYAIANSATATSASCNGFVFDSTTSSLTLKGCIACLNAGTGTSATGRGFFANSSTESVFTDNAAYRNVGTTTSIGFTQGAATNGFMRNVAVRNGTTTANQFSGFGASQFNTVAIASVNSITQPYTNAGLI